MSPEDEKERAESFGREREIFSIPRETLSRQKKNGGEGREGGLRENEDGDKES